jgi:hypothetical protein
MCHFGVPHCATVLEQCPSVDASDDDAKRRQPNLLGATVRHCRVPCRRHQHWSDTTPARSASVGEGERGASLRRHAVSRSPTEVRTLRRNRHRSGGTQCEKLTPPQRRHADDTLLSVPLLTNAVSSGGDATLAIESSAWHPATYSYELRRSGFMPASRRSSLIRSHHFASFSMSFTRLAVETPIFSAASLRRSSLAASTSMISAITCG